MNSGKFFKTFFTVTITLIIVLAVVLVGFFMFSGLGSKDAIGGLDEYNRGDRKNVLVMGTDKSGLRSDVIMIFSFSQKEKTINSVSVPRDTRVKLYGRYQKINAALAIGEEEEAISAVREVTGIPIHEYVKVNFQAVSDVVDAVGGVEFDVPQRMKYKDPYQDLVIDLEEGKQILDGEHALQLLRFRQYPMGDLQRIKVQQDFIRAAFEQKLKFRYVMKAGKVFQAIEDNITTSLTVSDVTKLARSVMACGTDGITTLELPTYMSQSGIYVIVDQDKIDDFVEENFK